MTRFALRTLEVALYFAIACMFWYALLGGVR